jgi:WD40 repeat protein
VLEGHSHWVTSLAFCGSRLLSGGFDGTMSLRVWGMEGEASRWRCERALDGHAPSVMCMMAYGLGTRAARGCKDGGIRVWSTETCQWAMERIQQGHRGFVCGMVVYGPNSAGVVNGDVGVRADGGGVPCRVA